MSNGTVTAIECINYGLLSQPAKPVIELFITFSRSITLCLCYVDVSSLSYKIAVKQVVLENYI